MSEKREEVIRRLRQLVQMRDNGQLTYARLQREGGMQSAVELVPEAGKWCVRGVLPQHQVEKLTSNKVHLDLFLLSYVSYWDAVVFVRQLGDVQLRLVIPLLGESMRNALKQAEGGSPLVLALASPDGGTEVRLDIFWDKELAQDSYARLRRVIPDTAGTLGDLVEFMNEIAVAELEQPGGQIFKAPDNIVVVTLLPDTVVDIVELLVGKQLRIS